MIPYIIVFLISISLFIISERIHNSFLRKIFVIIALLLPCVLSGMRSINVGTDTNVYAKQLYNLANAADSFSDFLSMRWWREWRYINVKDFEIAFVLLTYWTNKIFHSFQFLLFFIQLLNIVPLYIAITKFKQLKGKMWLCMLIYYLFLFNTSLNAMRQFIGISFTILALSELINTKKYLRSFAYLLIGVLFHKSSILILIIYAIYWSTNSLKNSYIVLNKRRIHTNSLVLMIIFLLVIFLCSNISSSITLLKLLGFEEYINYVDGSFAIVLNKILIRVPFIIMFILAGKSFKENNNNPYFYIIVAVLEIIILNFSTISTYSARIGFVFQFIYVISLPMLCTCSKNQSINRINKTILVIFLMINWYYRFVYMGVDATIPYELYR